MKPLTRSALLSLFLAACAGPQAPVAPPAGATSGAVTESESAPAVPADEIQAEVAASAGTAGADLAPLQSASSASGHYTLRWRPLAPAVPENEPFELELFLEKDGAPAPSVDIIVRGWMPDHGHGMLRRPEVVDRGDGSYLVRGMLLHMGGLWELFFDVYEPGARKDRVRFEVRL